MRSVRAAFRLTTALYPAMGTVLVLAAIASSRTVHGSVVQERVFPAIYYEHRPGSGTFLPGSFILNFFGCSLLTMIGLNLVAPSLFRRLLEERANVFYYIAGLIVAIVEVGADTLLPILALPLPWGFQAAVTVVHASFFSAVAVAAVFSRGSDRVW